MVSPGHITLIRPAPVTSPSNFVGAQASPSLALALLAAVAAERGHAVTAIDAEGEALGQYTPVPGTPYFTHGLDASQILGRIPAHTRLIGVSCMFSNDWIHHRQVVNAIHAQFPDVPILVGGEHATAAGEYVLESCPGVTACVLGEGEQTLLDVLAALEAGEPLDAVPGLLLRADPGAEPKRTPPRKRQRALDELPWPKWDAVPIHNYLDAGLGHGVFKTRNMPMLASRGCPYRCTFCSNPQMWGKLWNVRSPEDVFAEMRHYVEHYQAESFSFYDLTAIIRKQWILDFSTLIIESGLKITWLLPSGTRSEALDEEVVRHLVASGCVSLNFAPESGSAETLERIKKNIDLGRMRVSMRACVRGGINTRANIIFGFPGERPRDMLKTLLFIVQLAWIGLHEVAVFPFTPYPGSELYRKLRKEGAFPTDHHAYDLVLANNLNSNYRSPRSWNEHLSSAQLRMLLVGSSLLFYALQYTFHPARVVSTCRRVLTSKPKTLIERVLMNYYKRYVTMSGVVRRLRAE